MLHRSFFLHQKGWVNDGTFLLLSAQGVPDRTMVDPFVKTGGRAVVRATLLLFLPSSFLF
jgi:hypothetical protein